MILVATGGQFLESCHIEYNLTLRKPGIIDRQGTLLKATDAGMTSPAYRGVKPTDAGL